MFGSFIVKTIVGVILEVEVMLLMIMTLRQEKTMCLGVTIMNSFTNMESPGSPQIILVLHVDVRYVDPF